MVSDCTSAVFEGLITVGNPAASWVARWQRIDNYVAGNYAMKIEGQLPDSDPRGWRREVRAAGRTGG